MIKNVETAVRYLLFLPAFIPLVFLNGLFYPFMVVKTTLFRGGAIVLLAAFVFSVLYGKRIFLSRLKNPLTWIPGALLLSAYVSSLLGADFYHSFWSTFERGDGLLTLTSLISFFYIGLLYIEKTYIEKLIPLIVWVATAVAGIGVLQWIEVTTGINLPLVFEAQGRIGSTIGNAAFLAGYLGMTFFITLAHAFTKSNRAQHILFAAAALQLLAIIGTATRGTILALIIAFGLGLIVMAVKGQEKKTRTIARGFIVAGLIFVALFVQFRGEIAKIPFEPVQRIANISTSDVTVQSRLFLWGNLVSVGLEKPIFGHGEGQIAKLFNKVYDPGSIVEEWFDRAHNSFLDYFLQYGVIGLALYVGLLLAILKEAYVLMRRNMMQGLMFVLLGVTYMVQNFFVFDTATTLWLLFAVFTILLLRNEGGQEQKVVFSNIQHHNITAGALAVLVVVSLWFVTYKPVVANRALAQGYLYQVSNVERSIEYFKGGLAEDTFLDLEYGYQLYNIYTDVQHPQLDGEEKIAAYIFTRDVLAQNFERYPYDARTGTYLAHILDIAPAVALVEEERLQSVLADVIALSPKRAQTQYILANISLFKADAATTQVEKEKHFNEAIQVLEDYVALEPNIAEPYLVLTGLYTRIGRADLARERIDTGLTHYRGDPDVAIRAAEFYLGVEEWELARKFLEDYIVTDPENYALLYDLAKIQLLAGDPSAAQNLLEQIRVVAPEVAASDPIFLQSLAEALR